MPATILPENYAFSLSISTGEDAWRPLATKIYHLVSVTIVPLRGSNKSIKLYMIITELSIKYYNKAAQLAINHQFKVQTELKQVALS